MLEHAVVVGRRRRAAGQRRQRNHHRKLVRQVAFHARQSGRSHCLAPRGFNPYFFGVGPSDGTTTPLLVMIVTPDLPATFIRTAIEKHSTTESCLPLEFANVAVSARPMASSF